MHDIDATRSKLRRAALRGSLYLVWPRPMGLGLLAETLPADLSADLSADPTTLNRALYYLVDAGEIEHERDAEVPLYRLTARGVERHEEALIAQGGSTNIATVRALRMLRLRILQALDLSRPLPAGTRLIALALGDDTDLDLSEPALRRALAYLVEAGLVAIAEDAWRITAAGVAYLEGDGDASAGVARPAGY